MQQSPNLHFKRASTIDELNQILELQSRNLPKHISKDELEAEGFVSIEHDLELLKRMNDRCSHIIGCSGEQLIAYALCMHPEFRQEIELLKPMFDHLEALDMLSWSFMVMGQVCVDKPYRKKGVFRGLYNYMATSLKNEFDYIITEVHKSNRRSLKAHLAIGFKSLSSAHSNANDWDLLAWKIG